MTASPVPQAIADELQQVDWRPVVARLLEQYPDNPLPIVQSGNPVLRVPAQRYEGQLGELLKPFLEAMRLTMLAAPGVGVAAPQVGVGLALTVVHDPGVPEGVEDPRERAPLPHRSLINPAYEPVGDETRTFHEGCLSIDGWQALRTRWHRVRLTGTDENGIGLDEELVGWQARIIQHETDHLRGILYLDDADVRSITTAENLQRFGL